MRPKRGRPRRNKDAAGQRASLRIDPFSQSTVESAFGSLGNAVYRLAILLTEDPMKLYPSHEGTLDPLRVWSAPALLSPRIQALDPLEFCRLAEEHGFGTVVVFDPPWGTRFRPSKSWRGREWLAWLKALGAFAMILPAPWLLDYIHYGLPLWSVC